VHYRRENQFGKSGFCNFICPRFLSFAIILARTGDRYEKRIILEGFLGGIAMFITGGDLFHPFGSKRTWCQS